MPSAPPPCSAAPAGSPLGSSPPAAPDTAPVSIPDPRPPRRMAFALTPLADVMFQLLIFFMLSTTLAPYALLPLGAAPAADPSGSAAPVPTPGVSPGATPARSLIWHVSAGRIREGASSHDFATLPDLLARHQESGVAEIVIFAAPDARTQDLATVLEQAKLAQIPRLRLIPRPGRGHPGGQPPLRDTERQP